LFYIELGLGLVLVLVSRILLCKLPVGLMAYIFNNLTLSIRMNSTGTINMACHMNSISLI